jgi:hypothetical protein
MAAAMDPPEFDELSAEPFTKIIERMIASKMKAKHRRTIHRAVRAGDVVVPPASGEYSRPVFAAPVSSAVPLGGDASLTRSVYLTS